LWKNLVNAVPVHLAFIVHYTVTSATLGPPRSKKTSAYFVHAQFESSFLIMALASLCSKPVR
jgi:hypothetical protein